MSMSGRGMTILQKYFGAIKISCAFCGLQQQFDSSDDAANQGWLIVSVPQRPDNANPLPLGVLCNECAAIVSRANPQ